MGVSAPNLADDPVQFEAVIVPHRSLGRRGVFWVVGLLLALSAVISTGLWVFGAWPVIGFTGAEALLAIALVRVHVRSGRASEMLVLSDSGLVVARTTAGGVRSEHRLAGAWLRATLQERAGRTPALVVQDRQQRLTVGEVLGEEEKRQLATALREAIYRRQHPVFDNPQLRAK